MSPAEIIWRLEETATGWAVVELHPKVGGPYLHMPSGQTFAAAAQHPAASRDEAIAMARSLVAEFTVRL